MEKLNLKIGNNNAQVGSVIEKPKEEWQQYEMRRIEREIAQCEGCKGLPCQKKRNKHFIPKISYDEQLKNWYVAQCICKYQKLAMQEKRAKKMFDLAKIPAEYLGKTFADYKVDKNNAYAVEVAQALITRPNNGAYFYGKVGTGKTLLAAILAQEVIRQGREVAFVTVPTISTMLRSTFNNNSKISELDILEKLYSVPTLILDDVGLEKPTRFICSTICNIFNERYNARLQTILTSNYRLKELEKIFNNPSDGGATLDGSRLYDRCKEMCAPVEFGGESRR